MKIIPSWIQQSDAETKNLVLVVCNVGDGAEMEEYGENKDAVSIGYF